MSLDTTTTKYETLSKALEEATLDSYSHSTRQHNHKPTTSSYPINIWFDKERKILHKHLRFILTHDPSSSLHLHETYRFLLHRKKHRFICLEEM
jgi:hypothetical protein